MLQPRMRPCATYNSGNEYRQARNNTDNKMLPQYLPIISFTMAIFEHTAISSKVG